MSTNTQIKCPNCGTSFDVQDILVHQMEDEIKQRYQQQLAAERKRFSQEQEELSKAKEEFEQKKKQESYQADLALTILLNCTRKMKLDLAHL